MSDVLEQVSPVTKPRHLLEIKAEEIARDLALMDELEAFVQSLPKRTEGRSPTPQEFREIAYADNEVGQ